MHKTGTIALGYRSHFVFSSLPIPSPGLLHTHLRDRSVLLRTTIVSAAITVAALLTVSHPAWAEHRERGWHGDIRHFQTRDFHRWRGGRWIHGRHGDRLGWWWVVAGIWYFYPAPVYPYPDPYVPPAVLSPPPPAVAPQATPYWYYCESARAYYPYVASCPGTWQKVPAIPPDAPRP